MYETTVKKRQRQRQSPAKPAQAPKRLRVIPPTVQGHARFMATTLSSAEAEKERRRAAVALEAENEATPSPASTALSGETEADTPPSSGRSAAPPVVLRKTFEGDTREVTAKKLEAASVDEVTLAVAGVLEGLVEKSQVSGEAKTADDAEERLKCFFSTGLQSFSLESYVGRIVRTVQSRPVLVTSLIYIDRLREAHPHMALSTGNLHRVFTTAVLLACKFLEDDPCSLEFFRAIGGIPSLDELVGLEAEFLNLVKFEVFVLPSEYDIYSSDVLRRVEAAVEPGVTT